MLISIEVHAQDAAAGEARKTSPKFSGPLREPPNRSADALHLRLEVSFDWEKKEVTGKVAHSFRALEDLRAITLDAVDLRIWKVSGSSGQDLHFESLPGSLRIDLGREVRRGDEVQFTIDYTAQPRRGVYFSAPDPAYPGAPRQVWTQGEAAENRHWIPCIDHPVDKVTCEVLVTAPEGLTAISNGRLAGDPAPAPGGGRVFHWVQEKPMSTYLIACAVGAFAEYRAEWNGIPLVAYVPPGEAANAERSFRLTADMCQFFSDKTGIAYPWPKYAQVCAHDFGGGMENTSMTILGEHTLHDAAAELDVDSVGLVAHELAHQWFGDLVTCKDWSDLWLNESFATFWQNLYTEKLHGFDEGVYERMQEARAYRGEDSGQYRRSIENHRYTDPEAMFDSHSYPKGGRVLSMLRYVLGDQRFFAGIHRYLSDHAYASVETSDLRQAMESESGASLRWFFDQWVLSGGHPEYKVEASWDERSGMVRMEVRQVQRLDALTPLFRMPVEIELELPSGKVTHRVEVAAASEAFSFPAPERPRRIRFDPRDWVLKELDFPRPREELLLALADADVPARIEAVGALAKRPDDEVKKALLGRLSEDPFWGVRVETAKVLRGLGGEDVRDAFIRSFKGEKKSAVRREIVQALAEYPGAATVEFLKGTIAGDPSYFVVADSLRSLARLDLLAALAEALKALSRDSYQEEIRSSALEVIARNEGLSGKEREEVLDRLLEWHRRGKPIPARLAAGRALARIGRGAERAYQALAGAAGDPNVDVRMAAFLDLMTFGDRRAIEVLQKQKGREFPRLFRDPREAIDRAVKGLESVEDRSQLLEEIRRLRESEDRLDRRVKALEERRGARAY